MMEADPKNSTSILELQLESRWDEIIAAELILLLIVFIVALLGNGLIFVVFFQSTKLQTTQNMYIMSFAVVDILVAVFVAPFTMVVAANGNWIFGETVCQFQGFLISVLIAVTVLTMTLTALDRCFAMVSPEKYSKVTTPYTVIGINALVWFLSLFVPSSYILDGQKFTFHPGYLFCKPNIEDDKYILASILAVVYFILPLAVIAGSYLEIKGRIKIYRENLQEKQNSSKNYGRRWHKNEESARMFGAVTLAVLCLWIPFLLVEEIETFCGRYIMPRSIYVICSLLGFASFACKIFLYYTFNKNLKHEFHKAVKFRRSRRIAGTIQLDNTGKMSDFISSSPQLARNTQITNTDSDKQFDTEEDEDELQFDCRTPSPAFEHDSVKFAKRSKSRTDSGHFSDARTIPNTPFTPFETRPNSVVSIPKRAKSRKETVRFSDDGYTSCQVSQDEKVASQSQESFPRQIESPASRKAFCFTQEQSSKPFQRETSAPRTRFIVPQTQTPTPFERVEILPQKGNIVDMRKSTPSIEKNTVSRKGINPSQSGISPLPHRNNTPAQTEEAASVSQASSTTQEESIHSLTSSTVPQMQRSTSPQKVKTSMPTDNTTFMKSESPELESSELEKIEPSSQKSEINSPEIMTSPLNENKQPKSHEIGSVSNTANVEDQSKEKAGNFLAAALITSRDLPPVFPRKSNAKRNDNLFQSAARGRLTAIEHLRKNNKEI